MSTTGQRNRPRVASWHTGITLVEPNRILVRGYGVDELMGRVSFAEAIYLLLVGELPSRAIGRLMDALLVSTIDHGATPPSALAAREVATAGSPLRASVAAGVLALGDYHGGDVEACIEFLERARQMVHKGQSPSEAATALVEPFASADRPPPGFGHRTHTSDPRTARLFQMALELEQEGEHVQMIRAIDAALRATHPEGPHHPINVDGAIAAVSADLGLDSAVGNALFIIARVPGIIAQTLEEAKRERPMRVIDASQASYDGPASRRLPVTRR